MFLFRGYILGVTLFSAVILAGVSTTTVKADTTSNTSTTNTVSPTVSSPTATKTGSTSTASSTSVSSPTVTTTPTATSTTPVSTTKTVAASSVPVTSPTATTSPTPVSATKEVAASSVPVSSSTVTATGPTSSSTPKPTTTSSVPISAPTVSPTGSPTQSSGTGAQLPNYSVPISTPTSPTGTTTTSTSNTAADYSIPSNITDSTVVNFTDPTLANIVKKSLNLQPTADITVGDIRNYQSSVSLHVNEGTYEPTTIETTWTPITSLNGMQYLSLLPHDEADVALRLATSPTVAPDLTPLNNIKLASLQLVGNFSNPADQEINVNQIAKLNFSQASSMDFDGDNGYNGIDNSELATLAPAVIAMSNNGTSSGIIMNANSISDFSPLKGINKTNDFNINTNGGVYDPTPVYGVKGQPLTFTATPDLGVEGDDLAANYHFTKTVTGTPTDDDLINLGNDNYKIENPDTSSNLLVYGDCGFDPRYNTTGNMDSLTLKYYDNSVLLNITIHSQPLIWQDHPNVKIVYQDSTGKTITTKTFDGVNIGDPFDLTSDSSLSGYTLKSTNVSLKGNYTEAPQVIDLIYTQNPSSSNSSSNILPTSSTAQKDESRVAVDIHQITANSTGADGILAAEGVKGTTTFNGQLFYLVGNGQFVAASAYHFTVDPTPGVIRSTTAGTLVNAYGDPIGISVAPDTEWKYSRTVTINGADYYQVGTNEFLAKDNTIIFTPVTKPTILNVNKRATLYDSKGQVLGTNLPAGSTWHTDGYAIINGIKMYRVAANEWVESGDVNIS